MHVEILILTKATSNDDAITQVNNWLEVTDSFFDFFVIEKSKTSTLELRTSEVMKLIQDVDFIKQGKNYIEKTNLAIAKDELKDVALWCKKASSLFNEELNKDIPVYNMTDMNYSVPSSTENWFVVSVDFHC